MNAACSDDACVLQGLVDCGAGVALAARQRGKTVLAGRCIAAARVEADHLETGFIERSLHVDGWHGVGPMTLDGVKTGRFRGAYRLRKSPVSPEES